MLTVELLLGLVRSTLVWLEKYSSLQCVLLINMQSLLSKCTVTCFGIRAALRIAEMLVLAIVLFILSLWPCARPFLAILRRARIWLSGQRR